MGQRKGYAAALGPAAVLAWFLFFLFIPLLIVFLMSFAHRGPYGGVEWGLTLENYLRGLDGLYLRILLSTLRMAVLTTLFCFLLGFPIALIMALSKPAARTTLLILMLIPFWTNFIVRALAVKVFLGDMGPVNRALQWLGLISEPILLTNTQGAVLFAMVAVYLPFMVLPLFASLADFDLTLIEAARDLGAGPWRIVSRVILPSIWPGVQGGLIIVFIPSLAEFLIPDMMGGAKTMLAGNLINEQFLRTRDWPFGAAITVQLMLVCLLAMLLFGRRRRKKKP